MSFLDPPPQYKYRPANDFERGLIQKFMEEAKKGQTEVNEFMSGLLNVVIFGLAFYTEDYANKLINHLPYYVNIERQRQIQDETNHLQAQAAGTAPCTLEATDSIEEALKDIDPFLVMPPAKDN